ncbi:UDP-N-acetylmuramate--L-alanine ligase [Thermoflavifilum aggregans]|uniref:UDP-N-acetylmuramate--L-alanine ligase n=1 Tax=Thermoflavifilum aggregans TaxID=454188 RepID=A0A2M9CTJ5_9BACT|nr:UDP-N-acetylmuramate--L-alanine ligase [Thermoflavifilum aggregans]PJJ75191.1 UDP-N-acetylmuramate--L-alanine ligase [Thermoflavifilum aggregans]
MKINGTDIKRMYFIGIGGIGMSALARYFHEHGVVVSGYDRTPSALCQQLEQEGISVHYDEDIDAIDREADVVVYTPAIPPDHAELLYYRNHGYQLFKRSEMLGMICKNMTTIAVAGTHGKTTTTTLIAHILRHCGRASYTFLGGISVNYQTNYWKGTEPLVVVEADEYDRSFLHLHPYIAVVTSMDPDHLDIYGTKEAMQDAYFQFAQQLKPGGCLIYHKGIAREDEWQKIATYSYHLNDPKADFYAFHVRMQDGHYHFDVQAQHSLIEDLCLQTGGLYNVENAVAAIAVVRQLGLDPKQIKEAIQHFKGVKRRFEYILKRTDIVFIDDYAHHPQELKALLSSAKEFYPDRPLHVVFQPHLYSRTRDLAREFAASLDLADRVWLLPIYPARELPIPGVSSELIRDFMKKAEVSCVDKKELIAEIAEKKPKLLITAGAGDIDQLIPEIVQIYQSTSYAA